MQSCVQCFGKNDNEKGLICTSCAEKNLPTYQGIITGRQLIRALSSIGAREISVTTSSEAGSTVTVMTEAPFIPKTVTDFTIDEKLLAFDRLHEMALQAFIDISEGLEDDDTEHYIYESVMQLLGPGVWDAVNKLLKDK